MVRRIIKVRGSVKPHLPQYVPANKQFLESRRVRAKAICKEKMTTPRAKASSCDDDDDDDDDDQLFSDYATDLDKFMKPTTSKRRPRQVHEPRRASADDATDFDKLMIADAADDEATERAVEDDAQRRCAAFDAYMTTLIANHHKQNCANRILKGTRLIIDSDVP